MACASYSFLPHTRANQTVRVHIHLLSKRCASVRMVGVQDISARNLAVDNHTVYTPTLYYHYTPHYT